MSHIDDDDLQPILDLLDEIRQQTGWSRHRTFSTWVDLVLATLERNDDSYLTYIETIESVTDAALRPIVTAYSQAFGELVSVMAATTTDLLGAVYEHYGLTSDAFGQYFTPPAVAQLLATLHTGPPESLRAATRTDPYRIANPACGSGRLLLAAECYFRREAPDAPILFFGQDKDPLCARMTAINFALAGLSGYVTHGDSITLEAMATWKIDPAQGLEVGPIHEVEPMALDPGETRPSESTETTPAPSPDGQCGLSDFGINTGAE